MEKPLVSISTITYNHAPYIRQCLDGFLMQETNFKFEVLIHDDASTDGTEEIIRAYEAKYPDIIKPLYEKENQWQKGRRGSAVFNFPRAQGKYIALCEGDDYWTDPLKLQKQVDFLEENKEYSICSHNAKISDDSGNLIRYFNGNNIIPETTNAEFILANKWYMPTASIVFRKKNLTVPAWLLKVKNLDYAMQLLLTANGEKAYYLQEIMSVYRLHDNGYSNTFKKISSLQKSLSDINIYYNKFTQGRYKELINENIARYSLFIMRHSSKKTRVFWTALYRYLAHKKNISRQERNYLLGTILFPRIKKTIKGKKQQ
jgi:glycosyltransferase involved in cell wall biosynthesis